MIVAKFGGTSVVSVPRIETLCSIIHAQIDKKPIVVVSALSGVTDLLLSLPPSSSPQRKKVLKKIKDLHCDTIKKLLPKRPREDMLSYIDMQLLGVAKLSRAKHFSKATLDKLLSFGEIMSSAIVSAVLETKGIPSKQIIATDLIVTDNNFGSAEFLPNPTKHTMQKILKPLLARAVVPVVTGFIGKTRDGKTTTLGRGGSDYTASIIGFCLSASEIQIWTDVDGIMTADPKIVKNARLISTISFKEASEMATFGARVLHPRTIKPAIKAKIPVRVLNTLNPEGSGTLIVERRSSSKPTRSVCAKRHITLVNIYSEEMLLQKGFLAHIFEVFAKCNISVDLVSVSEVSISVTLDNIEGLNNAVSELKSFSQITVEKNLGIVSIIGEGIADSSETIQEIFATLHRKRILARMVTLGATDINISLVIDSDRVEETVKALHGIILN